MTLRTYLRFLALLVCTMALVGAVVAGASADELRGWWVDAWGSGIKSSSQVAKLLGVPGTTQPGDIREANCNAVFVQVRRRADVCYPSAMGEPYMSGLSPSNFNALQAVINAAHDTTGGKQRIEVHAWIVTFATSSGTTTSPVYYQHNNPGDPDNYWVTLDNNGAETNDKAFDPGHPRAQQYIADVSMDLVTNFDIDGLHFDYIRFTGSTQGYNPTSIARYNARYGLTGQPSPTNSTFKQWRRDQVTSLVRKVYAKTQKVKPSVKVSAALVTWNPSPTSSTRSAFQNTRPYYDVYCDWDAWMEEGILDLAVPMTYYNWASLPNDYTRWMNFQKDRKFNRHVAVGPGVYLNSMSNAVLELQMTRNASPAGNYANGFCGYSYRVPYDGGTWDSFESTLRSQVCPSTTAIPDMPWKSNPTRGHLMGTVTLETVGGDAADGAVVTLSGPVSRSQRCDGTGFYAFIDLPPGTYNISVAHTGYQNAFAQSAVTAGLMAEKDIVMTNGGPPVISDVHAVNITNSSASIAWTTSQLSNSQVEYGLTTSYGSTTTLNPSLVVSHTVNLAGLAPNTLYHYRVISSSASGTATSDDYTFTSSGPPTISNVQAMGISSSGATITWDTNAPADSRVFHGLDASYGSATPVDPSLVTSHSVALGSLAPNITYHYKVRSVNSYGADESSDLTFTTNAFTGEVIVDNEDPGFQIDAGTGWVYGTTSSHIGADYLFAYEVSGTAETAATHKARWTPDLAGSGNWDVYIYYAHGTNRSTNSYWKIVNAGSPLELRVNQEVNGNAWRLLASNVPFHGGTGGYVVLGNNTGITGTNQIVHGDAVRFVYKGGDIDRPSTPTNLTGVAQSTTSIQLTWGPSFDDHQVAGYKIYRNGVVIGTSSTNSYLDSGLNPNTSYLYQVAAYDGTPNDSIKSSALSRATLSLPPSDVTIVSDKQTGVWYPSNPFIFTAVGGFGYGTVQSYRYEWDTSPTYTFVGGEPVWSAGDLNLEAQTDGKYYLHVKGFNLNTIANGEAHFGPFQFDSSGPIVSSVTDEGFTSSTTQLTAEWEGEDPESGVERFEYCVGSVPGGTDVRDWTDAGLATSVVADGLALSVGTTFYFTVRGFNTVGIAGDEHTSQGVIVTGASETIGEAKANPDGTVVSVGPNPVTGIWPEFFYIEDQNRSSGIRVVGSCPVTVGEQVRVSGTLTLIGDCERAIDEAQTVAEGPAVQADLSMFVSQTLLGGLPFNEYTPGVTNGAGLHNIGLLIKTFGKVTALTADGFYLDDGTGRSDGSGNMGARVWTGEAPTVAVDDWVLVKGISSSESLGTTIVPVVLSVSISPL